MNNWEANRRKRSWSNFRYSALTDKVKRNCHFPAPGRNYFFFMERHLTRIGKILKRLAVCHAVPVGSREVTVALKFISGHTVLSRHLPEGTDENHKTLSQDSRSPSRDLNPGPSEYEAGVPTTSGQSFKKYPESYSLLFIKLGY
jgi:hypothetical protein